MSRIYVAGPMTGLPDFNYPAFNEAERALTERGHDVVNPARAWDGDTATAKWSDYMRRGITDICTAEAVALLPGWRESRGATLEHHVATTLGLVVKPLREWLEGA